jgi:hypothetical protein
MDNSINSHLIILSPVARPDASPTLAAMLRARHPDADCSDAALNSAAFLAAYRCFSLCHACRWTATNCRQISLNKAKSFANMATRFITGDRTSATIDDRAT